MILSGVIPDQRSHQYYPTPEHIAEAAVAAAEIAPGEDVLEVGLGDIRPDLIVTLGGVQILIEVAVTHYIDEEKRLRLEERGLRCIEISLGHVQARSQLT